MAAVEGHTDEIITRCFALLPRLAEIESMVGCFWGVRASKVAWLAGVWFVGTGLIAGHGGGSRAGLQRGRLLPPAAAVCHMGPPCAAVLLATCMVCYPCLPPGPLLPSSCVCCSGCISLSPPSDPACLLCPACPAGAGAAVCVVFSRIAGRQAAPAPAPSTPSLLPAFSSLAAGACSPMRVVFCGTSGRQAAPTPPHNLLSPAPGAAL